jgi:hypothetical protein
VAERIPPRPRPSPRVSCPSVRRVAGTAAALIALALAPTAGAWTTVAGGVTNVVVPSMIVTQAGTELVSFESPTADTISVSRNRAAPRVVVQDDPFAGRTQLVQQPNGAVQLYFPNAAGIARLTSTDDGITWTGPVQAQSHTLGGVMGAAVLADGTPLFSQDGTGFVNVFRGLNGEVSKNVFPACCGHAESIAVDTGGLVQVAFYSNAGANGTFVYEPLGADLTPVGQTPLAPTAAHDDHVPLVADHSGTTFLAWPPGYPTAAKLTVVPFRGGQPAGDGFSFTEAFSDGDPHMALSVDTSDRLWAIWTGGGTVHAARSRSHGAHFGAIVRTAVPGTAYQLSAVWLPGNPGSADVIVNTGSSLVEQQVQPGLSVRLSRSTRTVGKKKVVSWTAQALDDGVAVPTASFRVGGRTVHASSTGKATIPTGAGKASAPGYVAASFRVP